MQDKTDGQDKAGRQDWDRQIDRQIDRKIDRQIDRQVGGQRDRIR